MTRTLSLLSVVLIGVTLALGPVAWGQSPQEAPPPKNGAVITMRFPGGTIGEYVQAIRKQAPGANIVLASVQAASVGIPPIELDSVTVGAAVRLLQGHYIPSGHLPLHVAVDEIVSADSTVFRVSATSIGPRSPIEVKVWSVVDLLDDKLGSGKIDSKDILTAVETAVELLIVNDQPAQIRFHEATGLLLARGALDQLDAIDQVVDQLRKGQAAKYRTPAEVNSLQEQISRLKTRIDQLETQSKKDTGE